MKLILGLGNPGKQYERTRHNVGWWVLDHLADVWHLGGWKTEGQAQVAHGLVGNVKVRLVKPQTFMNLSGAVLASHLKRPFWSPKTDLLVVVDDVALPVGTYRLRPQGSAGGHNGLKSVEHHVGHRDCASGFNRWIRSDGSAISRTTCSAHLERRSVRKFSR